jgi:hypothetical protein
LPSRGRLAKRGVALFESGYLRPNPVLTRADVVGVAMSATKSRLPAPVRAGDRVVTVGGEFPLTLLASHLAKLIVRRAARKS